MSDERRDRFESLAAPAVDPLRRFLARRTDPDTADDALAETLLVAWRRIDEMPDDALPWLYGVARLCLANAERGARRQRRVAARIAVVDPPLAVAPEARTAADDRAAAALAVLPDTDAEVLRLWAWEQLAPAEIAVVLDTTPGAVSNRLTRAKQRLRAQLAESADSVGGARQDAAPAGHEESTEGRGR